MASSFVDAAVPHFSGPVAAVTTEEFKLFHSIDRSLFTRLVLRLGREPTETMQVMALWLWLEAVSGDPLIVTKLLSLPDSLLSSLADEAVLCLCCTLRDDLAALASAAFEVPLTQALTGSVVSLRFFHENRHCVSRGVSRFFSSVCVRAFEDVIKAASGAGADDGSPCHHGRQPQRQKVSSELGELLGRLSVRTTSIVDEEGSALKNENNNKKEATAVPQDDRTIFLTFSKGYPISESEVTDFFTKRFGEGIERIHMQEVTAEEQVLYARLVVDSPGTIATVLGGQSRAKFSINGKHVWARKYVRKNKRASPRSCAGGLLSPTSSEGSKSN